MRRLLVLIMIVLLPLRGWAGDLMGVQMAMHGSVSAVQDAMPPGCPMPHAQTNQAQSAPGEMKNCASCGLCIPLAELAFTQPAVITFFTVQILPPMGDSSFASASLAPTVKPPIF